jgi:hypothetical protein
MSILKAASTPPITIERERAKNIECTKKLKIRLIIIIERK